jgi:hypothetical protein
MKMKLDVDTRSFSKQINLARLTQNDMLSIEGAGAAIIVNKQRQDVPVDTAATKNSIGSHIESASPTQVVDEIGPETNYGLYLEYGTGIYAEAGGGRKGGWMYKDSDGWHFTMGMHPRPYVRPSVDKNEHAIMSAVTTAYVLVLKAKWPT